MRISRKTSNCLNCGRTLDKVYNYCPNCGQGNHDDNVSFKTLVGDFFSTYFAIDSKFGKSIKPFFIKPGYLTNKYVAGKRESYAHPIRLYLIVSIFYFFVVTQTAKQLALDNGNDQPVVYYQKNRTLDKVDSLDKKTREGILKELNDKEEKQLNKALKENSLPELRAFLAALDSADQIDMRENIGDSIADNLQLAKRDTTKIEGDDGDVNIEIGNDEFLAILNEIDYDKVEQLYKDYDLNEEQIYDSLELGELGWFDEVAVKQSIRLTLANDEQVVAYVVNNFPLMMLLLIPLFALILKLLYVRRDELYIKHLVHALHLHSFAYFLYGTFLIITIFIIDHEDTTSLLNVIAFLLVTTYAYFSFLKVYKQHWFKTLVKFNIVGFIYIFTIFFFFLAEMLISLLLF